MCHPYLPLSPRFHRGYSSSSGLSSWPSAVLRRPLKQQLQQHSSQCRWLGRRDSEVSSFHICIPWDTWRPPAARSWRPRPAPAPRWSRGKAGWTRSSRKKMQPTMIIRWMKVSPRANPGSTCRSIHLFSPLALNWDRLPRSLDLLVYLPNKGFLFALDHCINVSRAVSGQKSRPFPLPLLRRHTDGFVCDFSRLTNVESVVIWQPTSYFLSLFIHCCWDT